MLSIADESQFIEQLRRGDEQAFLTLVERHHAGLMRMAMVFVPDTSLAEEIVQETWLAVIHGIQTFEGKSSVKTWIFAIMSNQAKKHARRASRTVNLSALGHLSLEDLHNADEGRFSAKGHWLEPPARWRIDPEEALLKGRMLDVVKVAIEGLSEKQRIVFTMRDIQGFAAADVMSVLEISDANQRILLHRARAAIRAALEDHMKESGQAA